MLDANPSRIDADDHVVHTWVKGAKLVNANSGFQDAFIREFTLSQCLARNGALPEDQDLLQRASNGFLPSAIETGSELSVDNLDVDGLLDDAALKAEDLIAGLFDGAQIEVFIVKWADLGQGRLLLRKWLLREIKRADQRFSAEIRSLSNRLQQTAG